MHPDDLAALESHSVSRLIAGLKEKDPQAAGQVWKRFFERLLPLARARLKTLSDRTVDEEDILVSVFDRFFQAVADKRFAKLEDRDDLWQILLMLTDRRLTEQYRRSQALKRGAGRVAAAGDLGEAAIAELKQVADDGPSPEFVAAFNECLSRSLSRLEKHNARAVAVLKLEGYENQEVARQLGISLSSVERKLRLTREIWQEEFGTS